MATAVRIHPTKLLLYGGFASGGLFCWDLSTSKLEHTMSAHLSAVTGLEVGSERAVSCGRDAVAVLWDLVTHAKLATVPVFGPAEGVVLLASGKVVVAVGETLSVWDLAKAKQEDKLDLGSEVTLLRPGLESVVHCATTDLNLVTVQLEPRLRIKDTVVGNNDEVIFLLVLLAVAAPPAPNPTPPQVLDLVHLGPSSSHLVLASNSPALRLYDTSTWTCALAPGHRDTVLCLATCPFDPLLLASGSKDKEVRVWRLEDQRLTCLVVGSGHTEALGGLAWASEEGGGLYSVSKDTTLKVWVVGTDGMTATRTEIAHEKDINCVAVSVGGREGLVCTGGQDKVAKLWTKDLLLQHCLKGHTRSIWSVAFSPVDRWENYWQDKQPVKTGYLHLGCQT